MYNDRSKENKERVVLLVGIFVFALLFVGGSVLYFLYNPISFTKFLSKKSVVNMIDSDGDGLIDIDEEFYGSDPTLADTDGDGHGDNDEVLKDYNPVGEGTISSDYRMGLMEKLRESNSLYSENAKSIYASKLSGYSVELAPGWQYYGPSSTGADKFIYTNNGKNIISAKVYKGDSGVNQLEMMYSEEIKRSKVDLRGFDVLYSLHCENVSAELEDGVRYNINGKEGYKYDDQKNRSCYIARAENIYEWGKEETNLNINFYFYDATSKLAQREIADAFVDTYSDITVDIQKLMEYARHKDDATLALCGRLEEVNKRDECFYDLAIRNEDVVYCDLVIGVKKQDECESIAKDPVAYCNNGSKVDDCLSNMAVVKRDFEGCQKIKGTRARGRCTQEIAYIKSNSMLCEVLPVEKNRTSSYYRDGCYSRVAKKLGVNGTYICDMMGDDYNRQNCKLSIALDIHNQDICSQLTDTSKKTFRTNCYTQLALIKKDINLCNSITVASNRDKCKGYYNNPETYVQDLLKQ